MASLSELYEDKAKYLRDLGRVRKALSQMEKVRSEHASLIPILKENIVIDDFLYDARTLGVTEKNIDDIIEALEELINEILDAIDAIEAEIRALEAQEASG